MTAAPPGATEASGGAAVPLHRNRNYTVLWTSQLLSELTIEVVAVAVPLLILATSGSAVELGIASALMAAAHMVAVVPAGVLADRRDRRRIMLVCQALRAAGLAGLVAVLLLDAYVFPLLLAVVVLEGLLGSVFDPVEHATLPQVVPESQLRTAVARNTARPYVATMLGPVAAGLLFTAHPAGPFAAQAALLAVSCAALALLRLPRPTGTARPPGNARRDLVDGLRWVAGHRVVRATLAWITAVNLVFSAVVIIVLARAGEDDVAAGEIGLMVTCLGAGGVLGALLAARITAALRPATIVIVFSWAVTGVTAVMAVTPSGLPLGLLFGFAAFLAPAANTTVLTYQLLAAPDGMRGRLSGIGGLCSGLAGVAGPACAGVLATALGGVGALLVCAACFLLIALGTVLTPGLRRLSEAEPYGTGGDGEPSPPSSGKRGEEESS